MHQSAIRSSRDRAPSRLVLCTLLVLFGIVWFSNLEYRKLTRPDEGRYAEIAREMATSNDWVTPRLNGIKYFEKPPLQYWITAAAYTLFGEHHWTARLWPALSGFLGVLIMFYGAGRLYDCDVALSAAAITASSLWYIAIGHMNTLDMGLSLFMTTALIAFLLAQRDSITSRENALWMHISWAALALGVLSKGLIAIVLPAAVLVVYGVLHRDFELWRRLRLASGIAIFLAITAPWFVLVSTRNPEFFHFFFIHEHFNRFLLPGHQREEAWWYFIPLLIVCTLPWLCLLPGAVAVGLEKAPGRFQPQRLLLLWIVILTVFFSASSSKLPSYILPVVPALALLMALHLRRWRTRTYVLLFLPFLLFAAIGSAFIAQVDRFASDEVPVALYRNYQAWIYLGALIAMSLGTLAVVFAWRNQRRTAIIAFAFCGLASQLVVLTGHDALSPATSTYHLAARLRAEHGPLLPEAPMYSVRMYEQTLPFYLKRTMTLVEHDGEWDFGVAQEPWRKIASVATFSAIWTVQQQAYAVMSPSTFSALTAQTLPMNELVRDTRRVIVSRR